MDPASLALHLLGKFAYVEDCVTYQGVIIIQVLAFRQEGPVGEPDFHNAAVRDAEQRVIITVDKPDAVILLIHHFPPPSGSQIPWKTAVCRQPR